MGTGRYGSKHTSALRHTTHKLDLSGYRVYARSSEAMKATESDTKRFEKYAKKNGLDSAIYSYTQSGYRDTNPLARDLRYANSTTEEMLNDLRTRASNGDASVYSGYVDELENIHTALSKGVVPEAFVGYRGAGYSLLFDDHATHSFSELQSMVGKTVRDMGNMSVSMVPGKEFTQKPVMYEVLVPKGKGIGANVMGISSFGQSEGEFLFNNGAYYKVVGVTKAPNGKPKVTLQYIGRG